KAAAEKAAAEKAAAEKAAAEKAAAEKAAKEAAAKKAAAEKAAAAKRAALQKAMRDAAMGAAGMPGGTADRNQAGGGRDSGYAAQVRACIRRGVIYPTPPYSGANPAVQYRVTLDGSGNATSVTLQRSSG